MSRTDVFGFDAQPPQIPSRGDHPVPRLGIVPQNNPVSTNKFYANLFLGSQGSGVWTHPYSVTWSRGASNAQSWGMAISHIEANQRGYGPPNTAIPGQPVKFFINPIGIQSIILSAIELGPSTILTTDSLQAFSANANLSPSNGSSSKITLPLVQGMGFVTGIYSRLQPAIQSSVFFRSVISVGSLYSEIFKYRMTLEDNKSWLLYARSDNGQDPGLSLQSNTLLRGLPNWCGTIQIAKNPNASAGETVYDSSAGVYATGAAITGSTIGATATYQLCWTKAGFVSRNPSPKLIMFALPHHVQSFDANGQTPSNITSVKLQTATKGVATAVVADSWNLSESTLPTDIGFAPWAPSGYGTTKLSAGAKSLIQKVAAAEVKQDVGAQSNLDSMYFSGKALSKFATLAYAINDILEMPDLAKDGLSQLKTAFARFATNKQTYPLAYDTAWKGIVSSATYVTGDSGLDFGNTYYNDHHFHYSYFIHAAAIIGHLDPTWLPLNKNWVNSLVRDASSPSIQDGYFPFSRAFDWYHGHSFAKGLFESGDSKDEESTSEDAFFSYALKMWGQVTGDANMEARGNLMLAIQKRSFSNYFLMQSDNVNQPANFIANKVTGILFENKIDYSTYFGNNPEYIHGIHMLPFNPSTSFIRNPSFVREEWSLYFSPSSPYPAQNIVGGWKGILYANLATIDPKASWDFFAREGFDPAWLDGGATRTWALVCAGVLAGL